MRTGVVISCWDSDGNFDTGAFINDAGLPTFYYSVLRTKRVIENPRCLALIPHEQNLSRIEERFERLGLNVVKEDNNLAIGLLNSCESLKIATAMGAQVLEFHFTTERENKSFQDHQISLLENEVFGGGYICLV